MNIAGAPVGVATFRAGSTDPSRAILCLPGMGALGASFAPALAHLKSRHVLMLTPALHTPAGRSPLDHIVDVLASEQLPTPKGRPFDVLASSYGTLPAIGFALAYPERVRSLVLVSPVSSRVLALPAATLRSFLSVPVPMISRLSWLGAKIFGGVDLSGERLELVRAQMRAMNEAEMARRLEDIARSDLEDRLADLRGTKTLVLHGRWDFMPAAISRGVEAKIPGARFQLVDGGHMPYLSDPWVFSKTVEAFLEHSG